MCGTDYQHEVDESNHDGPILYASIKHLKKNRQCWIQCGIIKVKITLEKWEVDQDFTKE